DDVGINLSHVGGQLNPSSSEDGSDAVYIDNSNGDHWHSQGGLIAGDDVGIHLDHIANGNVVLDNSRGTVYGDEMAFALGGNGDDGSAGLTGGNVYITNAGGLMEGHDGSDDAFGGTTGHDSLGAITINSVHSDGEGDGGHVYIYNTNEHGWD